MAVLVTGGAGYIGSHTCVALLQAGYDVIVIDNFMNSTREVLYRIAEITGKHVVTYPIDVLDRQKLETVFKENNIDAVIHLAGLKAVGESTVVPLKYYRNNITGTVHLCEVMQKYGVKKLVFSSSATVYGSKNQSPLQEEMPLGAVNPYGRTKQMIEEILHDLSESDPTWCITILRYFNPIGAHESGRIGELPSGAPNNLMPYIAQVAIGVRKQLAIYGNDYPTTDGTGIRDYIHVVDLANGHLKALEHVKIASGIETYNLGTGRGYSVLEVVAAFERVTKQSIPYVFTDRRPGDIAICYANPLKAKKQLAWRAERGIDEMCKDVWRWQKNNPNGYDKFMEKSNTLV